MLRWAARHLMVVYVLAMFAVTVVVAVAEAATR